jgi:uncharacterized protein
LGIVVSDTSPIRALQHLQLLPILEALYGRVYVPTAVAEELRRTQRHFAALEPNDYPFFVIESPRDSARVAALSQELDAGEAAALVLALENPGCVVLLDERDGRRVAARLGLQTVGVLGILLLAKQQGHVPQLRPLIERLQREIDFRLAPQLISQILGSARE